MALAAFWEDCSVTQNTAVGWSIQTGGREMDEVTGGLTGLWSEPTPYTGNGDASGQKVADSTQALIRWQTTTIRRGRFLQGRSFLPGVAVSQLSDGNLGNGAVGTLQTSATLLVVGEVGLSVWGRPVQGAPGVLAPVTQASVWNELAVLRGRRG